jgi:uncharacterized protein (DUF427 family)
MNRRKTEQGSGITHPVDIKPFGKRLRLTVNGETIAGSKRTLLLNEHPHHAPVFYFPRDDVRMILLQRSNHQTHCALKGDANYWSLKVKKHCEENIAWSYEAPYYQVDDIKGHLAFYLGRVDAIYVNGVAIRSVHELGNF